MIVWLFKHGHEPLFQKIQQTQNETNEDNGIKLVEWSIHDNQGERLKIKNKIHEGYNRITTKIED